MSDWHPIATAPKDNTPVMLFWYAEDGPELNEWYAVGRWRQYGDGSCGWSGESFYSSNGNWTRLIGERPTHWMPLPDPPEVP